jgi:xylulokinase
MYLGIDIGTQSVKALLYDAGQRRVAGIHSARLDMISDDTGKREQLADWWLTALAETLQQFPDADRSRVQAISVSGQQHGFVPVAKNGEVLAPVKLWCDTTTNQQCDEIIANFGGEERCFSELGNSILPGYTAPKIRWLKQHNRAAYDLLDTILLPHDYLNFHLTGERVMECGDASGSGLLDVRNRQWHTEMLMAVDEDRDLSSALPPLAEPHSIIGQLRPEIAAHYGLPSGIPVVTGGGDNMMAAIGTGNVATGRMTISLGTSGTLFAYSDTAVIDESGCIAAFCSSTGGWLPLLCTMNCTSATELSRQLLGLNLQYAEAGIAATPAGSNGVVTLPFFNGERSPNLPDGKGCILGLDSTNYTQNNLLRSAMESAIYGLRTGLDAFRAKGCQVEQLRLTGGGAGSASWRQMVADIFALPVTVQVTDEGAALGAALQALWINNGKQSSTSMQEFLDGHLELDESRSCSPDRERSEAYSQYYTDYLRHVAAVTPLYT